MHWALTQFTPSTNNIAPDAGIAQCGFDLFLCGVAFASSTSSCRVVGLLRFGISLEVEVSAEVLLVAFRRSGLYPELFKFFCLYPKYPTSTVHKPSGLQCMRLGGCQTRAHVPNGGRIGS